MKTITTCLLIILALNIFAQTNPQWINCTNNSDVRDIVQSGDQLWMATTGGLVHRNLQSLENTYYNRGNSPIPSNDIISIEVDDNELLWMSTGQGISTFDGNNWNFIDDRIGLLTRQNNGNIAIANSDFYSIWNGQEFIDTPMPEEVMYMIISSFIINPVDDSAWFSFYTFGQYVVVKYDNQSWTFYDYNNSPLPFESPYNNSIAIDDDHRIWVGNYAGLYVLENETWSHFSSQVTGFPDGSVFGLTHSADNRIWAVVGSSFPQSEVILVEVINAQQVEIYDFPMEISHPSTVNFIGSPETGNAIYMGTIQDGCWLFEDNNWARIPAAQSPLSGNEISQIYIDDDITWMQSGRYNGYMVNTLFNIREGDWTYFDNQTLPSFLDNIYPPYILTGSSNETLWFYAGDTLLQYENNQWSVPQLPDILDDVLEINSFIHFEPDGKRWLLEKWQSYLFYESDQGWIAFPHEEHGAVSGAYSAYFNHPVTNDFWLASPNGISHYNGSEWEIIKPVDHGLSSNAIHHMVVTIEGVIWAGGLRSLLKIENGVVTIFSDETTPIKDRDIRGIALDSEENLWIGVGSAIAKYDGENWLIFDHTNSGVPNGRIEHLAFDIAGNLWVGSTQGGFAVYNEAGLADHFLEDLHTITNTEELTNSNSNCKIYPNPLVKGTEVKLQFPDGISKIADSKIVCYNQLGQTMWTTPYSNSNATISASLIQKLSSGVYYLNFSNQEQNYTCPVVVE